MRYDQTVRLLAEWVPLLLLAVAFFIFMRRQTRPGGPQQTALAEQKRHNDALEKILDSHEVRLQKLESERRS